MENFNGDAYKPKEIAARIEQISVSKSVIDPLRVFALALLAGAFIAFGAAFFTVVTHSSSLSLGLTRLIGGLAFCLGLILVIVAGAELFTGNNLLVMACVDKKITLKQLLLNWIVVFFGNLLGSLGVVLLIYFSGHWLMGNGAVGAQAVMIAKSKVNLSFMQAFASGILCNSLVCLAVWLCYASHTVTDKILAIIFPITAFVTLGFEHSVANMYFIPAGILAKTNQAVISLVTEPNDLSHLNLVGFINNLVPVTLGNIVGGSIFVGMIYWFIYLRD